MRQASVSRLPGRNNRTKSSGQNSGQAAGRSRTLSILTALDNRSKEGKGLFNRSAPGTAEQHRRATEVFSDRYSEVARSVAELTVECENPDMIRQLIMEDRSSEEEEEEEAEKEAEGGEVEGTRKEV